MSAPIFLPTQPAANLLAELVSHPDHDMQAEDWLHLGEMPAPVDVDLLLDLDAAHTSVTGDTLRAWARYAIVLAIVALIAMLAGCGGGEDEPEPQAGPSWDCWMQPAPCAPQTRLIEPPRDSRVL